MRRHRQTTNHVTLLACGCLDQMPFVGNQMGTWPCLSVHRKLPHLPSLDDGAWREHHVHDAYCEANDPSTATRSRRFRLAHEHIFGPWDQRRMRLRRRSCAWRELECVARQARAATKTRDGDSISAHMLFIRLEDALAHALAPICCLGSPLRPHRIVEHLEAHL